MGETFLNAYVLHVRPYSDSKLIVEWLTDTLGRLTTVARVPSKRSRANLQLFQKHLISAIGRGELKTLSKYEVLSSARISMDGKAIKYGLYLNELLLRILVKEDCVADIFVAYENTLDQLVGGSSTSTVVEATLRRFELICLAELGFAIDFGFDVEGNAINAQSHYRYQAQVGFSMATNSDDKPSMCFSGECILAINEQDFKTPEVLRASKLISRAAFAPILGDKPLKSRELFR